MEDTPTANVSRNVLTREEIVGAMWRLLLRPKTVLSMVWIVLLGIGLLVFAPGSPVWAWIFIVFPPIFLLLLRRTAARIVDQHPEYLEEQTLSFDESGITSFNSVTRLSYPWSRLVGVREDTTFYSLRFDTVGSAIFIPKRALSDEQRRELLVCLGGHQ